MLMASRILAEDRLDNHHQGELEVVPKNPDTRTFSSPGVRTILLVLFIEYQNIRPIFMENASGLTSDSIWIQAVGR